MENKINKLLDFLIECDKMKGIQRRTLIADGSRPETDAEHSWHLALMAITLADTPTAALLTKRHSKLSRQKKETSRKKYSHWILSPKHFAKNVSQQELSTSTVTK